MTKLKKICPECNNEFITEKEHIYCSDSCLKSAFKKMIEDIRGIKLETVFNTLGLKPDKKGFYSCPFHEEDTASLSINKNKNLFKCFGCDTGGDALKYYQELTKYDFQKAVKNLYGILFANMPTENIREFIKANQKEDSAKEKTQRDSELYTEFINYLSTQKKTEHYHNAIEYLNSRGIDNATIKKYHISIISDYYQANNHLKKTYDFDRLRNSGLVNEKGNLIFNSHKIVFPFFHDDKIKYLQARLIGSIEGYSKYFFLSGITPIPYNLDTLQNLNPNDKIYIVEGIIDCLTVETKLYKPCLALGTKNSFHDYMINLLKPYKVSLLYDNDKAKGNQKTGKQVFTEIAEKLYKNGITTYLANVKDQYKDVNEAFTQNPDEQLNTYRYTKIKNIINWVHNKMQFQKWYSFNSAENPKEFKQIIEKLTGKYFYSHKYDFEFNEDETEFMKVQLT